mgnify:CR=1 FL=1
MNKPKFAIGCLVQWYEIDMVSEYIETLKTALSDSDVEVLVDFTLNINQDLEKIDTDQRSMDSIIEQFKLMVEPIDNVNYRINLDLIMICDYRRWFLDYYCTRADVLMQGESDALLPKSTFTVLNHLHNSVSNQTPKYLATFGCCRMWDDSWVPMEHVEYTNRERDPKAWYGTRYTTSIEELNKVNDKVEDIEVTTIAPHKFNGCGIVLSSEVIKSGVNVPRGAFFIDDTALLNTVNKLLPTIPQYHFKNILLVHNREHSEKRKYVLDESGIDLTAKRNSTNWYTVANEYSKMNDQNIFNPTYKFKTWQDVWNKIKEEK